MDTQIERLADLAGRRSPISDATPASFWWTRGRTAHALRQGKRGQVEPVDLSTNLIVQPSLVE